MPDVAIVDRLRQAAGPSVTYRHLIEYLLQLSYDVIRKSADSWSKSNLKEYIQVNGGFDVVQDAFLKWHYTTNVWFAPKTKHTIIVVETESAFILAFSGSATISDGWHDVVHKHRNFKGFDEDAKNAFTNLASRLSDNMKQMDADRGFYKPAIKLAEHLLGENSHFHSMIRSGKQIIFVGHSLGAAVALLTCALLRDCYKPLCDKDSNRFVFVGYGTPRVAMPAGGKLHDDELILLTALGGDRANVPETVLRIVAYFDDADGRHYDPVAMHPAQFERDKNLPDTIVHVLFGLQKVKIQPVRKQLACLFANSPHVGLEVLLKSQNDIENHRTDFGALLRCHSMAYVYRSAVPFLADSTGSNGVPIERTHSGQSDTQNGSVLANTAVAALVHVDGDGDEDGEGGDDMNSKVDESIYRVDDESINVDVDESCITREVACPGFTSTRVVVGRVTSGLQQRCDYAIQCAGAVAACWFSLHALRLLGGDVLPSLAERYMSWSDPFFLGVWRTSWFFFGGYASSQLVWMLRRRRVVAPDL